MTVAEATPIVRFFATDETVRWSCQDGDFVLWVGTDSFLSSDRASAWTIRDFWQMQDDDFVTITNRGVDLPVWFELHPSETANHAAFEMMKQLNAGYQPKKPMHGPNIWRAKTGDRLVRVTLGAPSQPVREILNLQSCALVVGENSTPSSETIILFGAPRANELPAADAAAMRAGFDAAVALGVPLEFALEWRFGA